MIEAEGKRILSLSIDSGGSYTDAVIMDIVTKEVIAKIKSKTTHDDMIVGMMDAMDSLLLTRTFNPKDIRYVGLSTTLATNSILENKGGKVGLIRIGWNPLPDALLPVTKDVYFDGGHDVKGATVAGLPETSIVAAAKEMESIVDCIIVSSKFSCISDSNERMAKNALKDKVRIPVIAAYELSTELGIHERTNTAILNGMLLPVIDDFIDGVSSLLSRYGISARMMIMKGDGTVMNVETARKRPVETMMSGPAASVVGGQALSGKDTCVVIDVGSTSTDIAILKNGLPPVSKDGAVVAGKRTHVKNMDAYAIALGGDSHIRFSNGEDIRIGPNRAVPLATSSVRYPIIIDRLRKGDSASFVIPHKMKGNAFTTNEEKVLDFVIANAPCTLKEIYGNFSSMYTIKTVMDGLMSAGALIMTGLTPTDFMVLKGDFDTGNREASELGLALESRNAGLTADQFIVKVMNHIVTIAGKAIVEKIMVDQTSKETFDINASKIIDAAVGRGYLDIMDVSMKLALPVVGLGGPARVFLSPLSDRLGTEIIIPDNFDVGNAMGTVFSKVTHTSVVTIIPHAEGGYELRSPFMGTIRTMHFDDAVEQAEQNATKDSTARVEKEGGINITTNSRIVEVDPRDIDDITDVIRVEVSASGDPLGHLVGYHSS